MLKWLTESQNTKTRNRLVFCVFCVAILCSTQASAFEVKYTASGETIQWSERSVSYVIDPTVRGIEAGVVKSAVNAGFTVWTAVPTSFLSLVYEGVVLGESEGFSQSEANTNVVRFEDGTFMYDDAVLAVTLLTYESESGILLDADIVVNSAGYDFTVDPQAGSNQHDIQNTIAHEVGHFVGLAHTADDEASTMYPVAPPAETAKRTLSENDKDGISFLYPVLDDGTRAPGSEPGPTRLPNQSPSGGDPSTDETEQSTSSSVTLERVELGFNCTQTGASSGGFGWLVALAGAILLGRRRLR